AHGKTPCEVMYGYKLLGIYQKFNPTDPVDFQEIEVQEAQITL
ncbi:32286_t:CDS:1, partial [Racocetra persica]